MKKVLKMLLGVGIVLAGLVMATTPMRVQAAEDDAKVASDICSGTVDDELKKAAGCSDFGKADKTVVPVALYIINVVLTFVGLIAVGVIVYGGVLYVTSTGDSSKVKKAQNSIIYGVVGLVIAIMAFAIVSFINTSILQK